MKKIVALILALCLALATLPTLAEAPADLSGTWYLLMAGLTIGTFDFNADGTCVGATAATGEEKKINGTWAVDGNTVTLTVDGESLPLTYDGTDLTLGAEAIAAFTGSSLPEGVDISALTSFVKFTRDAGAITIEQLNAFSADGTIPEGKTKEEMEAAQMDIAMVLVSIAAAAVPEITAGLKTAETPEQDFTGTWYFVISGMTAGTFELNADGTCLGTSSTPNTEIKVKGTWAADGDKVTLTVGEKSLPLSYDGTNLTLFSRVVSPSFALLSSTLKFSREPGIAIEQVNAFSTDGTIPEGRTKDEMETVQGQLAMLFLIAALMD